MRTVERMRLKPRLKAYGHNVRLRGRGTGPAQAGLVAALPP